MSVRLRMQRFGAKKRPFYRIVAAHKESPRDGRFIEILGTYDPLQDPPVIRLAKDRVDYWVSVGATASETVSHLIVKLNEGKAINLSEENADKEAHKKRIADRIAERDSSRQKAQEAHQKAQEAEAKAQEAAKAEEEAKLAEAAAEEAPAEEASAEAEGEVEA